MVLFPTKPTPHYQVLTGRESMSLYMGGLFADKHQEFSSFGGLQVQLVSAWSYFLYTKRNPALLSTLNGKVLFAGLVASAFIFGRTVFETSIVQGKYQKNNIFKLKLHKNYKERSLTTKIAKQCLSKLPLT